MKRGSHGFVLEFPYLRIASSLHFSTRTRGSHRHSILLAFPFPFGYRMSFLFYFLRVTSLAFTNLHAACIAPSLHLPQISARAELRGPCWNANAVLGAVQLAPHVRSLRLKSRGAPQRRPTL